MLKKISRYLIHKKPSLAINALSSWGPLATNFIIGFLLVPYLINALGETRYGIWSLVAAVIGYYGFLRLGITAGIMRYVPYFSGKNDTKGVSSVISTCFVVFIFIGIFMAIVSFVIANPIAEFYESDHRLASLVKVMGIAAAIECPMLVLDAAIRSQERWLIMNLLGMFTAVFRALAFVLCVSQQWGIVSLGYAEIAVRLLNLGLLFFLLNTISPELNIKAANFSWSKLKILTGFGLLSLIVGLVYTHRLSTHKLIVGKLISVEAVTYYHVIVFIMSNIRKAVMAPARPFFPRFAHLQGSGLNDVLLSLYLRGTKLCALFSAVLTLMVFTVGPAFLQIWLDEKFLIIIPALFIMAIGYLLENTFALTGSLLNGTGHQKLFAALVTLDGAIGIALSILLGSLWGYVGIACGFLISATIFQILVFPFFVCRIFRFSMIKYLSESILRPYLAMGVLAIPAIMVKWKDIAVNWPGVFILAFVSAIFYFVWAYLFAADLEVKKLLQNKFRNFYNFCLKLFGVKPV